MALVEIRGFMCERCLHKWIARENSSHTPIVCPKCKSPYWNTPRENKIGIKKK